MSFRTAGLVTLQAVALLPVFGWIGSRWLDGSDGAMGLAAWVVAIALLCWNSGRPPGEVAKWHWPAALMGVYALSVPWAPALVRALLGMSALSATICLHRFGRPFHPGVTLLVLLGLPLQESLDFFLGFPFRWIAANGAGVLLAVAGRPVGVEGTLLTWESAAVAVDPPCSGIRMLWVLTVLVAGLAGWRGWAWPRAGVAVASAVGLALAGNSVRAASLFILETSARPSEAWMHEATGAVVFACAIAALWRLADRGTSCARMSPS